MGYNTELPPGSDHGLWLGLDDDPAAPRRVSVDVFADVVDYQRGAKEVVELMVAAAKKMKGEEWREEFGRLRKAMFGTKRRGR